MDGYPSEETVGQEPIFHRHETSWKAGITAPMVTNVKLEMSNYFAFEKRNDAVLTLLSKINAENWSVPHHSAPL